MKTGRKKSRRRQHRKTRRRQRGGLNVYNRPGVSIKKNHLSSEIDFRTGILSEHFDSISCYMLDQSNDWWEELMRPYRDVFLQKYKELHPEESLDSNPGIFVHCLDKCYLQSDKKVPVINTIHKPGLNIILSCTTQDTAHKLNQTNNKYGYYYLGFRTNVHYVQNIIIMPDMDTYDIAIQSIPWTDTNTRVTYVEKMNTEISRIARVLLEGAGGSVYYTTENIDAKIKGIVGAYFSARKTKNLPISKQDSSFNTDDGTTYTTYEKFITDTNMQRRLFPSNVSYIDDIIKRRGELERAADQSRARVAANIHRKTVEIPRFINDHKDQLFEKVAKDLADNNQYELTRENFDEDLVAYTEKGEFGDYGDLGSNEEYNLNELVNGIVFLIQGKRLPPSSDNNNAENNPFSNDN